MQNITKVLLPTVLPTHQRKDSISMVAWKLRGDLEVVERWMSTKKWFWFISADNCSIHGARKHLELFCDVRPCILWKRIHLYPFKPCLVQKLIHFENYARLDHAIWCSQNLESCSFSKHHICFSEQCLFNVTGEVDEQSVQIWGAENLLEDFWYV